jgi:hypothetical protein
MENITEVTDSLGEIHVVIDRGNGEYTSMTKATYDAQLAAQKDQPIGGTK